MAIKVPLKMSDGTTVRTIEELREHFNLADVLGYYSNGRLIKWLENWFYDEEAEKVKALDSSSEEFKKELCMILGVDYSEKEAEKVDLDDISKRNERREQLKKYTADDRILALADSIAFTQNEVAGLLKKADILETDEDDNKVIYLCGDHFTIPGNIGGIIYKGINKPKVEFDEEPVEAGIDFQNLEFDIDSYIVASPDYNGNYNAAFFGLFDNNPLLGVKLLHMAAEKGSAAAQYALGLCYIEGYGVEEDYHEALKHLQQAAGKYDANANFQYLLGICYKLCYFGGEPAQEAVKCFEKAASQGHADAQGQLGKCYMKGDGVEQDLFAGAKWCQKAAEQGVDDEEIQYYLGYCYYHGEGGIWQDYKEAAKWLQKAAIQDNADAQVLLGDCYQDGTGIEENEKEAVKWYRKAAEQGNGLGQIKLGSCYAKGSGVEKNEKEAAKWYRKVAEQGVATAQYILGICYEGGIGIEQNLLEAVKWYRKAAEQGYEDAQNNLDECLSSFDENDKIVKYYQKAVEQDDPDAQNYLGLCYEEGRGVEPDTEEAAMWYEKAAAQGHEEAQKGASRCLWANLKNLTQNFADSLKSFGEDLA